MAALRFEVGRSFGIVGNVLVLGFVFGKISAILGKVSASLDLGRLASILRRPAVDLGAVWGVLRPSWERFGRQVGAKWPSWARFGPSWGRLGPS